MNMLIFLMPIALLMGGMGLLAFLWSLTSRQYDDLKGAAWRILVEDETDCKRP
ncbi:cytochrome oxidase maturation protein, cbb3-type [Rhizobium leguminosarum bv. trifolii]|uniref:Cytochrome oxidase maturation protein, cbb3-type n=2 Tax=Rhizobium TaxID=379 RepID=A0A3E1AXK7_RHILT|nr:MULTISPECIES: cbb3-type cytochrome oxidase assembly protein CcoS [Rhizobium]KPH04661.1 cytochrome oxidase maturation protein [Rhizobium acidisoli]QAS81235.1 cbb3-type cytochrome oxidase assembly protein CcoS [Rhizobium acidisoli]RFB81647.1 cytochrome oxidase maturation protein, cbb3-type [Rhizobium leguminosarum bv. trifolii]